MIQRYLLATITRLSKDFPCIAILGPRQIGKTTLAKLLSKQSKKETIYLDAEKGSDAFILQQAEYFFDDNKKKCIIIDEVQFLPNIFNTLRPAIDEYRKPNRFILTGSASLALVKGVSESLAGRVAYVELTPIGLLELPPKVSLQKHWFYGGFPLSITAKTNAKAIDWLNNFIKSYVERDLNQLFHITLSTVIVKNFWRMLANNNGGILNAENYARALGVTGPTVLRYIEYLEGAFLVRRLLPWYVNANKRLVKAPKVFIRDSGLLHRLVDIDSMYALQGNILIGASWEGYVIEQIAQQLPNNLSMYYYRTQDGAEVDVVLVKQMKVIACIEVKVCLQQPKKGFYESCKFLQPKHMLIIANDVKIPVTLSKNVKGLNIFDFLNNILPKL